MFGERDQDDSFETTEIVVVNRTDYGMMGAPDDAVVEGLEAAAGGDLDDIALDPALREHPVIPESVTI